MFKDMNWKPVSAEFLGTFFLVFFGVTSFISMSGNDMLLEGTITLGLTLFVLVHILGPVSGCHLNPVITIPNFLSDKIDRDTTIAYICGQIVGACLGFYLFDLINPGTNESILDGDAALLLAAAVGTTFFVVSIPPPQDPPRKIFSLAPPSKSGAFFRVGPSGLSLGLII